MRALRYFFEEAIASLWGGRRSGVLSVITIAAALFVFGAFLLITSNVERVLAQWNAAAEMSVYFRDEVSAEERNAVERLLDESGLVAGREYLSKSDALSRFKRQFADLADVASSLTNNPFPSSIEVRLRSGAREGDSIEGLAARLRQADGVEDVRYDRQWIGRLLLALAFARGLGLVLGGILTVAAALTVATVVRLAGHARHDEIEIMHLVGAPIAYIRGPFVVEGILQGGAGALVALVLLWAAFAVALARYGQILTGVLGLTSVSFLPIDRCVWLLVGGMTVGCIGGLVAARSVR